MTFHEGWVFDPDSILESQGRMEDDGLLIAESGNLLKGRWKASVASGRTAFLASTVEDPEPAYRQHTGVCTSMIYRALQDCLNWDRVYYGGIGRTVKIAPEPIFAGSRIEVGKGRLGGGDGSIGAWVAEWIARYGVVERGVYGNFDLRNPREDLAQSWGKPGVGVPQIVEEAGKSHRFKAHRCLSADELADGLAGGCFGGICRSHYCSRVDGDGMAVFEHRGGHHTCLRGVFLDTKNRRVFVEQQSHGSGVPDRNPIADTQDGPVSLSDGAYKVREEDISRFIANGEVWVFQPIEGEEFR